jgi:hypothetical protein
MDSDRELKAQGAGIRDLDAVLKAAGIETPDGRLPGLATEYEQILVMAARLRAAEDLLSWTQKP